MNGPEPRSQQSILREYGIRPTRKRGQNFLTDGNLARAIAADVLAVGDRVLELGAGGGALTRPLLDGGARVLAVEVDRKLCALLRTELDETPGFTLQEDDIATLDWPATLDRAGDRPVVAGNLPYVLTSAVLFALADNRRRVAGAVLMVQKEVAQRLASAPGCREYGVLSVVLGSFFDVEVLRQVPAQVFWPRPDVRSAVVGLTPRDDSVRDDAAYAAFKALVKTLFGQRRKQIATVLRGRLGLDGDAAVDLLERVGVPARTRPEDIDRETLWALSELLRGGRA